MCGQPTSWEPSIATGMFSNGVTGAAWSPCSKFIAISYQTSEPTVEILDAVTFMRLTTLEPLVGSLVGFEWLVFSPDSHLLTWFGTGQMGCDLGRIISWDIQTGILVSSISTKGWRWGNFDSSVTYSICGTMFGVLFCDSLSSIIHIYNALSGTLIQAHQIKEQISGNIWTCSEYLQYATMTPGSIAIWEHRFGSTDVPIRVKTVLIPDSFYIPKMFLSHPTHPWLVLVRENGVYVWSTQDSKFLLEYTDTTDSSLDQWMSFSPNGHCFACGSHSVGSDNPGVYLWEESHTCYIFHQWLTSNLNVSKLRISPDGGSIIVFGGSVVQLWHTMDSPTPISTVPAQASLDNGYRFILRFHPSKPLVAVVREEDEIITVLDLKSGTPQLSINTGMKVYALGIAGDNIAVVDEGKLVTWNLPTGVHLPNPRADITNSVQTITLNHEYGPERTVLVSPDLCYIAIVNYVGIGGPCGEEEEEGDEYPFDEDNPGAPLYLYNASTGKCHWYVWIRIEADPWFTPDGYEVRCRGDPGKVDRWKIVEDSESKITRLESLGSTLCQPEESPWESSNGYQVIGNQWILNPSGKRLFWLPPHWRSNEENLISRIWSGHFLALLHSELPEVVILDME